MSNESTLLMYFCDAEEVVIDPPEQMMGYEAALPYLLSGHDGTRCGSDERHGDAPMSYSQARSSLMGAAGRDF